jgi:hypothetical protein
LKAPSQHLTIPSVYGGNILMWAGIFYFPHIVIDEGEYFEKQTFRNRMEIAAESGVTPLIIPLQKGKNSRQPMKDVQISYAENWPSVHKKTIFSAYGKAAYFEHYEPDIHALYAPRDQWLVDWNYRFFEFFLKELISAEKQITRSSSFTEPSEAGTDWRKIMTPKATQTVEHPPYYHVFFDKYPQPKNLSVFDLLLNEGPNGYLILKNTRIPA